MTVSLSPAITVASVLRARTSVPDLFLTSAQRPQCPQCPTIAQRSQDATGEGGAMANGDRSRQRASQRSALTMQIHDAPACHNRNTTFAPPCMGPPRDSQFCGIERGRFRRMPDGDYSARRETSQLPSASQCVLESQQRRNPDPRPPQAARALRIALSEHMENMTCCSPG